MSSQPHRKKTSTLRVVVTLSVTLVVLVIAGVVGVFAWIMLQPRPDYHAMLRDALADPWGDGSGSNSAWDEMVRIGERYSELEGVAFSIGTYQEDGYELLFWDMLGWRRPTEAMLERIREARAIVLEEELGERLEGALDSRPAAPTSFTSVGDLMGTRIEAYKPTRRIARAELALARLDYLEGRPDEALARIARVSRLTDAVSRQGLLMDALYGSGLEMMMISAVERWIDESPPDVEMLRRLIDLLGESGGFDLARVYDVERRYAHATYDEYPGLMGVLARTRHASIDRVYDEMIDTIELHRTDVQAADAEFRRLSDQSSWLATVLDEQALDASIVLVSFDGVTLQRRAARIMVALELYEQLHGTYPQALDELVPGILDEIPTHNFDGGTFLYHRYDEGEARPPKMEGRDYALYVVGLDGEDNGGTPKTSYNNVYGDLRTVGSGTPDASLRGTDYVFNRSDRFEDDE